MATITSTPRRFGAGLAVPNSDRLAALDPDGLTIGSKCWNADVGEYFTLTRSSAALVTDEVVAVYGVSGSVRWIKDTTPYASVRVVDADPTVAPAASESNLVYSTESSALFVYAASAWHQIGGV